MNMFVSYQNGNYQVLLNTEDGTKIRYNGDDHFTPNRPESLDVKITNQCQHGCVFCHENSKPNGKVATLNNIENFIETLPPYTEIAVGGGNIMESYNHTRIFLKKLKKARAIPSITVRQHDFMVYNNIIQEWKESNLIYGIGISLDGYKTEHLIQVIKNFPTAVIHVIAGMLTEQEYRMIAGHNLKILILGYKIKGRGEEFWKDQSPQISKNLVDLINHLMILVKILIQ